MTWEGFFKLFREYRFEMLITGFAVWVMLIVIIGFFSPGDKPQGRQFTGGPSPQQSDTKPAKTKGRCVVLDGIEICDDPR